MNNSSRQIRRIREVTPGTTPGGNMLILPFETFGIDGSLKREKPGNVRADRQITDNPATDIEVSGSASADVIYGDYRGLIEEVCCNAAAAAVSVTATTIAAVVSGNKLTGTSGVWTTAGFVDGDLVVVSGFSTNGASWVAMVNGTPAGTDLPLDANFKTLVAETAGPSVTVSHAGRIRLGTSLLTATYEDFNTSSGKGDVYRGVGCTQWVFDATHPGRCKQNFQFRGLTAAATAALLANASTQPSGNRIWNTNKNFGDADNVAVGIGFRYGGALMPNLRIKSYKLTVSSPLTADGAAGTLGPVDLALDDRFDLGLELSVFRNSADAETLIADAANQATEKSIGIGFRDNGGKRSYLWTPILQPHERNRSQAQQSGKEMATLKFMAKASASQGMFQYTELG